MSRERHGFQFFWTYRKIATFRPTDTRQTLDMKVKKTPLTALLLLAALVGLSSCFPKLDDTEQVITWDHFATGFVEKPVIYATYDMRSDLIYLQCTRTLEDKELVTILKEEQRPRVAEHALRLGDKFDKPFTFRGLVRNGGADVPLNIYYATPISSIEIVSSIDWGKELPAGASLNGEFAYFTGCSDQFAKTQKPYEQKELPTDFPIAHFGYRSYVQRNFYVQLGRTEILYGLLSDLDLTDRDYIGISYITMVLATDNRAFRQPQDLTFRVTFRDGQTTTVTLPLNKPQTAQG